jgi:hypothetical protein
MTVRMLFHSMARSSFIGTETLIPPQGLPSVARLRWQERQSPR